MREALEYGPDSRTAFRPYLVDKEPDEDDARKLAAIVGWPPVETEPQPDLVIGKPADLATAILALTAELTAMREERMELVGRVRDLEASVKGLVAPSVEGTGDGATPRAPAGSAG